MGKICSVNALIQGIYGWGEGYYSNEAAEMYELFWTRYIPKKDTSRFFVFRPHSEIQKPDLCFSCF